MLGFLYRFAELAPASASGVMRGELRTAAGGGVTARIALWRIFRRAEAIVGEHGGIELTDAGNARAMNIVRSHRLWESYLVKRLGLRADHVHAPAMRLEHVTTPTMQEELSMGADRPTTDPHGKRIPDQPTTDDA